MIINTEKSIGIIGGTGKTGGQFARLFKEQGFSVEVSGADTADKNPQLLAKCDVVIFAVPLQTSVSVIRQEIANATRNDQLLLDLCSLKTEQVQALSKAKGEVIGMHPLFGPSTEASGQTIILCPGRCSSESQRSLEEVLHAMGLRTLIFSPEQHDHLMAMIQVVPHLKSFLMGGVLSALHANIEELLHICTPAYGIEIDLVGRFVDDEPSLYGPILLQNPETVDILTLFRDCIDECIALAKTKDHDGFAKKYKELQSFFGTYGSTSRERTEACIRTLTQSDISPHS